MATIDELSVRVSADVASFIAGAEGVEEKLEDLSSESIQTAAALEILSGRADDASDQIDEVGRSSTATAAQMGLLSSLTNAANSSFLGITATTYAALIPALIALSAALAPVIGALGGFVAVAGAIGGIGMVATLGAISEHGDRLRAMFTSLSETVMDTFAPVFDEAAIVLISLMGSLRRTIEEMDPAGEMVDKLGGLFQELGEAVIDVLPAFVDLAAELAGEFLPPFVEFAEDILPEVPGMVRGLVDVFRRMIPRFRRMGELLADFLPAFTELGFTVLSVLGPALTRLFEIGTDVLDWFNDLNPVIQKAGAALAVLAPAVAVLGKLFGGVLLKAGVGILKSVFVPLVATLGSLVTTITGAISGMGSFLAVATPLTTLLPSLSGVLSTIVGSLVAIAGVSVNVVSAFIPFTGAISGAIATVSGLVGGLGGLISTLGTLAVLIGTGGIIAVAIAAAIGLFVKFEDEIRAVMGRVLPIVSDAINSAMDWIQTTGATLTRQAFEALGSIIRTAALEVAAIFQPNKESVIITALQDMVSWIRTNGPGLLRKAWNTLVDVTMAAFQGLYDGLIGNSLIPEMIADIKGALNDFSAWVRDTFTGFISNSFEAVAQAIGNAFGSFEIDWPPAFQQIIDFFGGSVAKALQFIEGKIDLPDTGGGDDGDEEEDDGGSGGGSRPDPGDPPDDSNPPPPPGTGPPGPGPPGRIQSALATPPMASSTGSGGIDSTAVADGFDDSQVASEMRDKLDRIDRSVRDDGSVRVREQDVVRSLEQMFDRNNTSL